MLAMVGKPTPPQQKLFYYKFNLDEHIRNDHTLKTINALIDFDFVSKKVEQFYGITRS